MRKLLIALLFVSNAYAGGSRGFTSASSQSVNDVGTVSSFSFIQNTGVFTLSTWIQINDASAAVTQYPIGSAASSANKGIILQWTNSGGEQNFLFQAYRGVGGQFVINGSCNTNVITDQEWHLFSLTGDGSTARWYIDGEPQGTTAISATKSSGDSTRTLNIGRYNHSTPGGYFDGKIADTRFYPVAYSASQIRELYQGSLVSNNPRMQAPFQVATRDISNNKLSMTNNNSRETQDAPPVFHFGGL